MKINLEATLKKEQKRISKLERKYGWKPFIIFSIIFFVGSQITIYSNSLRMLFGGLIITATSIGLFFWGLSNQKKRTCKDLQTNSIQNYLKERVKEYLVYHYCYHENVLTYLVSKYSEKSKLQFNSAILISLIIFVLSPFWGLLLHISYENHKSVSTLFFLLAVVIGIVFFLYALSRFLLSMHLYNSIYMRNLLEEILLDYYFEQNSKS